MLDYAPLILLLLAVLLLFRATGRARARQREILERQAALAPGDRVVTTSGLHGMVVEVGDGTVVLETGPGQRSTWAKAAMGEVLTSASAPADDAMGRLEAPPSADEAHRGRAGG